MRARREKMRTRSKHPLLAFLFLCCVIFDTAIGRRVGEINDERNQCHRCSLWVLRDRNHHSASNRLYGDEKCTTAFLRVTRRGKCYGERYRFRHTLVGEVQRHSLSLWGTLDDENDDRDFGTTYDDDQLKKRREEWIDGRQMMQILAREKAEEQRREKMAELDVQFQRRPVQNSIGKSQQSTDRSYFVSRISTTDANTLEIEIPPSGMNANAFATGAFSALWFSAVAPATLSMLSAGLVPSLFMAPFWLAGGVVAKTAVYDPLVSCTLSIGQYLWTLEKKYLKSIGLNTKKEEGPTESLNGASVELAMVVNNVGRYQVRLFFDGNNSVTFGKGLAQEELEDLSRIINDHCAMLREST